MRHPNDTLPISQRAGIVRAALATLLLGMGALLAQVSHLLSNLGRRWLPDTTVRSLSVAIDEMRGARLGTAPARPWERGLLRVGQPIVVCVFGALALLWTLLLLGGALAWLALNGYGLLLLFGTITIGVLCGLRRARLEQQLPRQNRLN